ASWSNFLGIFQIFPSTQTEQNLGHFSLVALVVVLGIAGTITGFASTAGIATVIVLVYLYVFIPIVAVIIFAAASAAVAYGWWWWVTFGPK
uniref:hypothetical protein n=1 Tax=Corynebacterium parakroppenstedtii TaxID=2828363 RepID=UPI0030ED7267